MGTKLPVVLDACLGRISNSRTIETCLVEYPTMRQQLEQILYTALSISAIPKVSPSDEFGKTAKIRLISRLHQESILAETAKSGQRWHGIAGMRKVAVTITVVLLLALGASFIPFGTPNSTSTPSVLAADGTLSILSGSVETQKPDSAIWEQAQDSMTLQAGTRLRTAPDSQAILTFFEGSTLTLEANADVEIQQVAYTEEQQTIIILKQWVGRTWSNVVHMSEPGSQYEVQTPSAYASVRGTLFMIEVDEEGATTVQTVEGLVAVGAQTAVGNSFDTPNEEVNVPAGYETYVGYAAAPSEPTPVQDHGNNKGHDPDDNNGKGSDKDNGKGSDKGGGKGQDNGDANGQDNGDANGQDNGGGKGSDKDNGKGSDKDNGKGSDKGGGNGQDNGDANGQDNGDANGQGNGDTNGQGNGDANGQDNGNANGQDNSDANGQDNGNANGQGNGDANGQDNGDANGQDNGDANGQGNGDANGQGNGGGKGSDKGSGKGSDKGGGKGSDKGSDKGSGKGSDKGNDKGSDKGGGKGSDKDNGKGSDKGGGKYQGK